MKFRFCGDQDCPDWILAEVSVMSKMSSVRMMLISRLIRNNLLGEEINYEKLNKLTTGPRLNFDAADIKAMIAALRFIIRSAAKYDVNADEVLLMELQQLGLPMDICKVVCKCYSGCRLELRETLQKQTLHMPRVEKVDWRVDYLLSSSALADVNAPSVRMNLQLSKPVLSSGSESVSFEMAADKFRVLFSDLKAARQLMESAV
mmetsp:Transcript_36174/g.71126  ORF Transcript_36174/g.71126 Transcript_36174/m.71126 type:complete len:204 (+) Transcript_36174:68-679(+)|eukprot:CAMPEP_0175139680 /NCGR_PEP_ID=MMETSP0087-20121206/11046_1 /TAXON_ID=136419 /ORGANISM="Unknown Unknown, Strain D1" /LENGTH=203 /DNA_ID=CAMNT_0016422735 /DNA_START=68 /DNA_END=679 /DNA_ORIENTATION=-